MQFTDCEISSAASVEELAVIETGVRLANEDMFAVSIRVELAGRKTSKGVKNEPKPGRMRRFENQFARVWWAELRNSRVACLRVR